MTLFIIIVFMLIALLFTFALMKTAKRADEQSAQYWEDRLNGQQ